MAKIQAHIIFKGEVQGVGFRYTVIHLALSYQVTGWVKNLDNGDVEVVVEAEQDVVGDFLDKIRNRFRRYISDEETELLEPTGKFKDFQIRF